MTKKTSPSERSWLLIIFSSLLILFSLAIVVLSIIYFETLGAFAIALIIGGLFTAGFAVMAIVKNDPSWILIDLILP